MHTIIFFFCYQFAWDTDIEYRFNNSRTNYDDIISDDNWNIYFKIQFFELKRRKSKKDEELSHYQNVDVPIVAILLRWTILFHVPFFNSPLIFINSIAFKIIKIYAYCHNEILRLFVVMLFCCCCLYCPMYCKYIHHSSVYIIEIQI